MLDRGLQRRVGVMCIPGRLKLYAARQRHPSLDPKAGIRLFKRHMAADGAIKILVNHVVERRLGMHLECRARIHVLS